MGANFRVQWPEWRQRLYVMLHPTQWTVMLHPTVWKFVSRCLVSGPNADVVLLAVLEKVRIRALATPTPAPTHTCAPTPAAHHPHAAPTLLTLPTAATMRGAHHLQLADLAGLDVDRQYSDEVVVLVKSPHPPDRSSSLMQTLESDASRARW